MNGRPPPQPLPPAFCRDRLAAWAAERLPALRAEPIPPCRHPGVTLLIYAFPADGRFDLFEFAIRQAWSALGALPPVVVTHDPAIVPPLPGTDVQREPTLVPGRLDTMDLDCVARLHTRFATPHVLIIQDDGLPLRDDLDRFLPYDLVGAPDVRPGWRARLADALGRTTLNGGLTLRSRRLCQAAARLHARHPRRPLPPEDRFYSQPALRRRFRFAPAPLAAQFSQDALDGLPLPPCEPMGLHRAATLVMRGLPQPPLTVVSVVRDPACHRRCLLDNPHLRGARFVTLDNTRHNLPIPLRYNAFLDALPPDAGWVLFAHEDFEPRQDPRPLLRRCHPFYPHGLIGTRIVAKTFIFPFGAITDSDRDGSRHESLAFSPTFGRLFGDDVENFDCCGFFLHAELIRATGLRFDPRCAWDLYAEDLCFQFILRTGRLARVIPLAAHHWSHGDAKCRRFLDTLDYLHGKYRDAYFAGGTCTLLVGRSFPLRFKLWRLFVRLCLPWRFHE